MERNSPGDVMLSESTADGTPARGCGVWVAGGEGRDGHGRLPNDALL